jgi:hypothetical protein
MNTGMLINCVLIMTSCAIGLTPAMPTMSLLGTERHQGDFTRSGEFFGDNPVGASGDKSGTSGSLANRPSLQDSLESGVTTSRSNSTERQGISAITD